MSKEPENEVTWEDFQEQVRDIRTAVDALDPPPAPHETLGQATYQLRQATESMENTVEAIIRREMGEE